MLKTQEEKLMDAINYDLLMEKAMHEVVQKALEITEAEGLPGNHHFFITFNLNHPNVEIHESLVKENLEEMTIVIQHQFSLQKITKYGFGVTLSFSGTKHDLYIPFTAITSFTDPHAKFGLQFLSTNDSGQGNTVNKEEVNVEKSESTQKDNTLNQNKKPASSENIVKLDNFRKP